MTFRGRRAEENRRAWMEWVGQARCLRRAGYRVAYGRGYYGRALWTNGADYIHGPVAVHDGEVGVFKLR